MRASELAAALSTFSPGLNPAVLVKINDEWRQVRGVDWTGEHRNGIHILYDEQTPIQETTND